MLSIDQKNEFELNGYIGPFSGINTDLAMKMKATINDVLAEKTSPTYGHMTHRDWHLSKPSLLQMIFRENVISKLKQLLGEDIILWRTSIFNKSPGAGSLGWHQAHLFAGEEYGNYKPAFYPPDGIEDDEHYCLSVWFSLDDININNGPMVFAKGTHKKRYPVKKVPFLNSEFAHVFKDFADKTKNPSILDRFKDRYANETLFDPIVENVEVDNILMQAGEFIIFSDRTMHASLANQTKDKSRIAINFRVIKPSVQIYPHQYDGDYIDGNEHNIENHACVMISGQDRFGLNKYQN
jgi:non-heme Fe2+,alpha-ketoglutarate-dependent halogenase